MKKIFTFLAISFFFGLGNVFSQAQMPNGDFESWSTTYPNNRPTGYYTIDTMGIHSCYKTTDMNGGTYAAMLRSLDTTIIVFNVQVPGMATLGRVNVSSYQIYGGIPFTNKPDNFRCYYKYLPNGIDTMMIAVYFWHYDNVLHQKDTLGGFVFDTSATINSYTYLDIPIPWDTNYTFTPDSMNIILLASYTVQNHSAAFFDDFSFYYLPVGLETPLDNILEGLFPNPAAGMITLKNVEKSQINIYNLTGEIVLSTYSENPDLQIDLSALPRGVYIVRSINEKITTSTKLVLQ
jgi:hypothetical protein